MSKPNRKNNWARIDNALQQTLRTSPGFVGQMLGQIFYPRQSAGEPSLYNQFTMRTPVDNRAATWDGTDNPLQNAGPYPINPGNPVYPRNAAITLEGRIGPNDYGRRVNYAAPVVNSFDGYRQFLDEVERSKQTPATGHPVESYYGTNYTPADATRYDPDINFGPPDNRIHSFGEGFEQSLARGKNRWNYFWGKEQQNREQEKTIQRGLNAVLDSNLEYDSPNAMKYSLNKVKKEIAEGQALIDKGQGTPELQAELAKKREQASGLLQIQRWYNNDGKTPEQVRQSIDDYRQYGGAGTQAIDKALEREANFPEMSGNARVGNFFGNLVQMAPIVAAGVVAPPLGIAATAGAGYYDSYVQSNMDADRIEKATGRTITGLERNKQTLSQFVPGMALSLLPYSKLIPGANKLPVWGQEIMENSLRQGSGGVGSSLGHDIGNNAIYGENISAKDMSKNALNAGLEGMATGALISGGVAAAKKRFNPFRNIPNENPPVEPAPKLYPDWEKDVHPFKFLFPEIPVDRQLPPPIPAKKPQLTLSREGYTLQDKLPLPEGADQTRIQIPFDNYERQLPPPIPAKKPQLTLSREGYTLQDKLPLPEGADQTRIQIPFDNYESQLPQSENGNRPAISLSREGYTLQDKLPLPEGADQTRVQIPFDNYESQLPQPENGNRPAISLSREGYTLQGRLPLPEGADQTRVQIPFDTYTKSGNWNVPAGSYKWLDMTLPRSANPTELMVPYMRNLNDVYIKPAPKIREATTPSRFSSYEKLFGL